MVAGKDYVEVKEFEDFIYRSHLKTVENDFLGKVINDEIKMEKLISLDMEILNKYAEKLNLLRTDF